MLSKLAARCGRKSLPKNTYCWTSQRVSTDASTLSSRLSTLDSRRSKMGFVQNATNWSFKTQVVNSPAKSQIDWKTSGFCKFSESQKAGFCLLQSCLPFRGQNGSKRSKRAPRGDRHPWVADHAPTSPLSHPRGQFEQKKPAARRSTRRRSPAGRLPCSYSPEVQANPASLLCLALDGRASNRGRCGFLD